MREVKSALGPYSAAVAKGLDGRTTAGRLARQLERELVAHCGGNPSIVQKLLIGRVVRIQAQINALDRKLETGSWTDHDARTLGGLQNALRLSLRELGLKAASDRPARLADVVRGGGAAA